MRPSADRCPKHNTGLQDFNGDGEPYRRPVCLECRWESGAGPLIVRILRKFSAAKGRFLMHWGPVTVFIRRSLTSRLNRLLGKRGFTLEEIAPMAGKSTEQVMARLRRFEEKRGSVRIKQTPKEKREQMIINSTAQHRVDPERMSSLSDPDVAYAADFARYRELGGAQKRKTSEA